MNTVPNPALERVKRIIRELQAKTTENGCTEAEAMAAAQKMGELLEKHDLEMDEVGLKRETADCKKQVMRAADNYAGSLCTAIGRLCDLIVWRTGEGNFTFFGTPHDLLVGEYLYEVCSEAMDYGWSEYMQVHGYSMKKRQSYRMGFANRAGTRLMELREARKRAATGNSLVVVKDQLVKSEFDKLGMNLRKAAPQQIADTQAYLQGVAAGERVNLNNPLGGPSQNGAQIR